MKKFKYGVIACLIAMAMSFAPTQKTEAQNSPVLSLISTGNSLAKDTVTNTAAKVLMVGFRGGYTTVIGITVDIVKISGTLGGTIIPVCSNDGVNFYAAGAGTFTATDVTNQGVSFSPPAGFAYYGVRWTGTGTMSGSIVAKINGK